MSNTLKEIKIELTNKCPLGCVHCSSISTYENDEKIAPAQCFSIIEQAHELGLRKIAFSGGEPLLWSDIVSVVIYAKKMGLDVSVYTTGNIDRVERMIDELKNAGVDRLIFSLYSNVETEHNRVTRRRSSFNNTLFALETAYNKNIKTEIHFVALASNYKRLTDIAEFSRKIHVGRISVLRFVPQGRGKMIQHREVLNKNQNIELRKTILNLRKRGFDIRTGSPFNVLMLNANPKCMAAQDRFIIDSNLNLYPCDAFKQIKSLDIVNTNNLSNLEQCSVKDCWEKSPYLQAVRDSVNNQNPECVACKNYEMCASGCLAQKYVYYEDLNSKRDPACLIGGK